MKVKILMVAIVIAIAIISATVAVSGSTTNLNSFELKDLQGNPFNLNLNLNTNKKKKLIVFWGTWCKECRQKMKEILPSINKRKDVDVLTINMDSDISRVKRFVEKENIKLTVLFDSDKKLVRELKVFAVPHWALYEQKNEGEKKVWTLMANSSAFDLEQINKTLGN